MRFCLFMAFAVLFLAAAPPSELHPPNMEITELEAPEILKSSVEASPGASDVLAFAADGKNMFLVQLWQRTGSALVHLKEAGATELTQLDDHRGFVLAYEGFHIALMNNGEARTVLAAATGPDSKALAEAYAADFRGSPSTTDPTMVFIALLGGVLLISYLYYRKRNGSTQKADSDDC